MSPELMSVIVTIVLAILGGAVYVERRLTKIETLMTNHLAHHDSFEKLILKLMRNDHAPLD